MPSVPWSTGAPNPLLMEKKKWKVSRLSQQEGKEGLKKVHGGKPFIGPAPVVEV
jgi:hypothetical protein